MISRPPNANPGSPARARHAAPHCRGLTILEVMIAAIVLVLGITTAITTMQSGFQALDVARNYTYAAQVMQSELERLRLKSWDQVQTLQNAGAANVALTDVTGTASKNFTCVRTISDTKTDMKEVTLVSSWRGYDGRPHTLKFVTRYGHSGLYDYFYTAH